MDAWWEALTTLQRVFICIAIPSTLVMVVQFILTLVGIGAGEGSDVDGYDGDLDTDTDLDGDGDLGEAEDAFNFGISFRLFTLRGMIAFLAVMGWVGYGLDDVLQSWAAVLIAIASGFVTMVILAALFALFGKLQSNGNMDIRNALGQSGTVYLKIPAKREGSGKITLVVQEKFDEFEAVTDEEDEIPYGQQVVVIGITGSDTLVVKRK